MPNVLIRRAIGTVLVLATLSAGATAQDNQADARRLTDALGVHAGSIVADIGAGDGQLTIPMAREVGPSGRVYATDLAGAPVKRLREAIASAHLDNVEIVEGHALRTNLPPECCDGIFIRNVYHHFANPLAMNASLWQSLKGGARLAIIDFAPNGREAAAPSDRASGTMHGVAAETVARELEQAGFELVSSEHLQKRTFLVVVRKPAAPKP